MRRAAGLTLYASCVLVIWELAVRALHVPLYLLPPPSAIAAELLSAPLIFVDNAWVTFFETLVGFVLASILGVMLALVVVYSKTAETLIMPAVLAIQSIPKVAIAPLFVVWFGLGFLSKLVLVSTTAFFPILLSAVAGLSNVDRDMVDLIVGMNGSRFQLFAKVRIPHSLPFIFNGMKIAVPFATIGAIVGEFIASEQGLGNLILVSSQNLKTTLNFASIIVIAVLSGALYQMVAIFERFVLKAMPQAPAA